MRGIDTRQRGCNCAACVREAVAAHRDEFIHVKWGHVLRGGLFVALTAYAAQALGYFKSVSDVIPKEKLAEMTPFDPLLCAMMLATLGYVALAWLIFTVGAESD